MERYTYFEGGKCRVRIGDAEYCGPWVDRLAAYEDTGLKPEEIDELKLIRWWSRCEVDEKPTVFGTSVDRLRELAQADRMAKSCPGKEHHKGFDDYIDHPDAIFISESRTLVTELIKAVATLQSEITKKDKETELLRKAMIKADFAYYFSPDYLDEDTKE